MIIFFAFFYTFFKFYKKHYLRINVYSLQENEYNFIFIRKCPLKCKRLHKNNVKFLPFFSNK